MFMVSEEEARQIREGYLAGGEARASQVLRGLFAGLVDNQETRASAVTIAQWHAPGRTVSVVPGGRRSAAPPRQP